ncbi:hypothetical protein F4560_008403 [Saccharothrix ecbatanensis]|uniref:Lipoprotein n=1 Tax=Saccharothrix ecbatanensis TaxID=1105145 RepID=A0A7W9HUA8_9PSEU|nr:hypothetical protein [Saccharothrix ecbatanensis]MBB5808635.1 hypothetical protein [Saccharothrix ecbatanensis]
MRSLGTALGAGALLVALVGCSSQGGVSRSDAGGPVLSTESATATLPSAPTSTEPEFENPVPPGGKQVPKDKVDASQLPEGTPSVVWTEADGNVIGAVGVEGGCSKASLMFVKQDAQQVHVELVETTPSGTQACTMDIRYPPLGLKLDTPLGDRKVVITHRQAVE